MGLCKDIFFTPDGRTFHLGVKAGELSPFILTVGSQQRARFLAEALLEDVIAVVSPRLFVTLTGYYKGVQVSIVAIGMGAAAMDFLLREAACVLPDRPLAVVRLGTCGIFLPGVNPGTLMLSDRSAYCYSHRTSCARARARDPLDLACSLVAGHEASLLNSHIHVHLEAQTHMRNYAHFDGEMNMNTPTVKTVAVEQARAQSPYVISAPVDADPDLTAVLEERIKKAGLPLKKGLNCSAETFYACQGRTVDTWDDEINSSFVDTMRKAGVQSMEMETHQLFHLLAHRKVKSYAAAIMHGIFNRVNPELADRASEEEGQHAFRVAGEAALEALLSVANRVSPPESNSTAS